MGKAPQLPTPIKKSIVRCRQLGDKVADIALRFNASKATVSLLYKRFLDEGSVKTKPRSGRPKKMTAADERLAVREVKKNPRVTAADLVRDHQLPISPRSTRRMLAKHGLHGRRPCRKPLLSRKNRLKRLQFARRHRNWDQLQWGRVLWSDESKFNLFSSDGVQYVRRPVGQRYDSRYQVPTVKHGGGSVMVWGK